MELKSLVIPNSQWATLHLDLQKGTLIGKEEIATSRKSRGYGN